MNHTTRGLDKSKQRYSCEIKDVTSKCLIRNRRFTLYQILKTALFTIKHTIKSSYLVIVIIQCIYHREAHLTGHTHQNVRHFHFKHRRLHYMDFHFVFFYYNDDDMIV